MKKFKKGLFGTIFIYLLFSFVFWQIDASVWPHREGFFAMETIWVVFLMLYPER